MKHVEMKGVTYFLDLFFFLALAIVTILFLLAVFFVSKVYGEAVTIEHNIEILYEDSANEDILLSFLETTECEVRMRDAIAEASYQLDKVGEKEHVYARGCIINLTSSSLLLLNNLTSQPYRLSIMKDSSEIVIAEKGKISNQYEFVETKLFTPNGEFKVMFYSG